MLKLFPAAWRLSSVDSMANGCRSWQEPRLAETARKNKDVLIISDVCDHVIKECVQSGCKVLLIDSGRLAGRWMLPLICRELRDRDSVLGTAMSVLVMAYPLARKSFKFRKPVNFFVLFTMLFSGGMVPLYILNTRYLHLDNTIWVYILPSLVTAYNLFIIKTGYGGIPEELIEAAKVDGVNGFYICFRIMIPLAKASLATVGFLILVAKWNDWYTASVYIRDPQLYSLQFLLQKILKETEYMKQMVLEGRHYEKIDDTHIRTLEYEETQGTSDTTYAAWKWVIGNTQNVYLNQECIEGDMEIVTAVNEDPVNVISEMMGFRINMDPVATEVSQCAAMSEGYR